MAIEDIFRALEEQAESDCANIIGSAKAQADGIIEDAEAKAEEIRRATVQAAEAHARSEAGHVLNAAKLAAKKSMASAKGEAIEEVFQEALDELSRIRESGDYETLFEDLLREAAEGVEGEFTVQVDPADEDLARKSVKRLGLAAKVEPALSTSGGVVVSMAGGRILRRNTLESRLERVRSLAQSRVAGVLFPE
ncbi:MAG: hypothetical protein Kow0056_14150 [Coriobacteriia bacterium]